VEEKMRQKDPAYGRPKVDPLSKLERIGQLVQVSG
jgi:hypothetical protein